MRSFELAPIVMMIILTVVLLGAIGLFVLVPVALIEWGWNVFAKSAHFVPEISSWQAMLLYIALALVLYISGLVRIEVRIDTKDV